MQDEIEQKTISLSVTAGKFTAKVFYDCLKKYLENKATPMGKQSLRKLKNHGEGLDKVDVDSVGLKEFKRSARKYNVAFSVTKERGSDPPKYLIHFKGKDENAINSAMRDALSKVVEKESKTPLLEKLAQNKEKVSKTIENVAEKILKRGQTR